MRSTPSLLLVLGLAGLLSACGGGGGAAPAAEPPAAEVFPLRGDVLTHQPKTIHYRVTGQIEYGHEDPVTVEGTAVVRQAQPQTVGGFPCACLEREEDVPPLGPTPGQLFARRDELAGDALQVARRLSDGDLVVWHTPYVEGPLRYVEGASWSSDDINIAYSQQASAPRLEMDDVSWSIDRIGIVSVPAGTFECYVVYRTERVRDVLTGVTEVISSIEYMRPDYGVVQATVRISRIEGEEVSSHVLTYEAESIY